VLARSRYGRQVAEQNGVANDRVIVLPPAPDEFKGSAISNRDEIWERLRVRQPRRLVCTGELSCKQDVMLIAEAFAELCKVRSDTALVFIGKGRWLSDADDVLRRLPVYRMQPDALQTLAMLGSADLLLHCDRNDVCGQWVIDGQILGVPTLVGSAGAGSEFLDDGLTGMVLPQDDASAWSGALAELLGDEPRRLRMSRTARLRSPRVVGEKMPEKLWEVMLQTVSADADDRSNAGASPTGHVGFKRSQALGDTTDTEAVIA
jgi:glycosyltransferase involved in cell wall biosynthesis